MNDSDALRKAINNVALEIARSSSDLNLWRAALVSLLTALESKARDKMIFEAMLSDLCDDLALRIEDGHWQIS